MQWHPCTASTASELYLRNNISTVFYKYVPAEIDMYVLYVSSNKADYDDDDGDSVESEFPVYNVTSSKQSEHHSSVYHVRGATDPQ